MDVVWTDDAALLELISRCEIEAIMRLDQAKRGCCGNHLCQKISTCSSDPIELVRRVSFRTAAQQ